MYVRIVAPDQTVSTLLQGACAEDPNVIPPKVQFKLQLKPTTCFRNWKKTGGAPTEHIYSVTQSTDTCLVHDLLCGRAPHPLIKEREFASVKYADEQRAAAAAAAAAASNTL